jgi:hypothetical protein
MPEKKVQEAMRTVSFFRLVIEIEKSRDIVRLPNTNWQAFLATLAGMKLIERTHEGPIRRLIGETLTVDDIYALKLMEPRDENSWLEILRKESSAEPVGSDSLGELVETTIVAFLYDSSIVGIIRGSTSSPTHTALAEWLDNIRINGNPIFVTPGGRLRAEPALAKSQRRKLSSADGVSMTSVRISTTMEEQARKAGSEIIADTLQRLKHQYGDVTVTVTLRVPRGKRYDEARRTLKEEAKRLQDVSGSAESVSATLVTYDEESRAHQEIVDFITQRITTKRVVPLTGDDGAPIRNSSAVRAILSAAHELKAELNSIE